MRPFYDDVDGECVHLDKVETKAPECAMLCVQINHTAGFRPMIYVEGQAVVSETARAMAAMLLKAADKADEIEAKTTAKDAAKAAWGTVKMFTR